MENYVGLDIILNDSQVKEQMKMEILNISIEMTVKVQLNPNLWYTPKSRV